MNLYNTLREFERIRQDFDHMFGSVGRQNDNWRLAFLPGKAARRYPMINLYEDKDAYRVEALAPGIEPSKFDLSIVGNVLTLSGEKTQVNGDVKPEAFHRSERAAGKFIRTLELPSEVDAEKVSAEYRNGVLYIHVPKVEAVKPKSIEVKVA